MKIAMLFKPTQQRILIFFGLVVFFATLTFLLVEVLNEGDIAGIYLIPLLRWPLALFDFVTFSQFAEVAADCSGLFLCFPTTPQLLFIFVFDILALYLISCALLVVFKKAK